MDKPIKKLTRQLVGLDYCGEEVYLESTYTLGDKFVARAFMFNDGRAEIILEHVIIEMENSDPQKIMRSIELRLGLRG